MYRELDPTWATGGHYDEGVGKRVCVGPWLLRPGEKKKNLGRGRDRVFAFVLTSLGSSRPMPI